MTVFNAIDLSLLPAPSVVQVVDYEIILAEILADFYARMTAKGVEFSALLESDPAYILAEAVAYREMLVRQRANESAVAVMLAYATGSDLDQIGATFHVERLLITPANDDAIPPTPAVFESDEAFRYRIQLSFEGFTTAGSEGSYVFHGLSAHADVKDIQPVSPTPGQVVVYVLSSVANGLANAEVIAAVESALNAERVRPLTDQVIVQSAAITSYEITAELTLYPGPDSAVVLAAAEAAIGDYVKSVHRIGYDVNLSGIYRALNQPGVQNVTLTTPTANLIKGDGQAAYCTDINLTVNGATSV